MSIYFPMKQMSEKVSELYSGLDFAQMSTWMSFIMDYLSDWENAKELIPA